MGYGGEEGKAGTASSPEGSAVDLIIAGDTCGAVTLWRVVTCAEPVPVAPSDGGSDECGRSPRRSGSGSRSRDGRGFDDLGGFVHRGPEGRRRGSAAAAAEEGLGASRPRLVPVLEYRAHQVGCSSGILLWAAA